MPALGKERAATQPAEPSLEAAVSGDGIEWKKCGSRVFQSRYVLGEAMGKDAQVGDQQGWVVLMRVAFDCPSDRSGYLEVSADSFEATINGQSLGYHQFSDSRLKVQLRKGRNVLVLRVFSPQQDRGGYPVAFEFSDADSIPFDDLEVADLSKPAAG
jgi:hypothetical protein